MSNQFLARQSFNKDLRFYSGVPGEWPIVSFYNLIKLPIFSNFKTVLWFSVQWLQKCLRSKAKDSVNALLNQSKYLEIIMNIIPSQFGRNDYTVDEMVHTIKILNTKFLRRPGQFNRFCG